MWWSEPDWSKFWCFAPPHFFLNMTLFAQDKRYFIKNIIIYKGRAFPLVGVTVRHLCLTVADAVIMITEESHYFSGGSMSTRDKRNK